MSPCVKRLRNISMKHLKIFLSSTILRYVFYDLLFQNKLDCFNNQTLNSFKRMKRADASSVEAGLKEISQAIDRATSTIKNVTSNHQKFR